MLCILGERQKRRFLWRSLEMARIERRPPHLHNPSPPNSLQPPIPVGPTWDSLTWAFHLPSSPWLRLSPGFTTSWWEETGVWELFCRCWQTDLGLRHGSAHAWAPTKLKYSLQPLTHSISIPSNPSIWLEQGTAWGMTPHPHPTNSYTSISHFTLRTNNGTKKTWEPQTIYHIVNAECECDQIEQHNAEPLAFSFPIMIL